MCSYLKISGVALPVPSESPLAMKAHVLPHTALSPTVPLVCVVTWVTGGDWA